MEIIILNQPELYTTGDGAFALALDVTVRQNGVDLPSFHKTVVLALSDVPDLLNQKDSKEALAYLGQQIVALDPVLATGRMTAAAEAGALKDIVATLLGQTPVALLVDLEKSEVHTQLVDYNKNLQDGKILPPKVG
jgi:hypothetical protein